MARVRNYQHIAHMVSAIAHMSGRMLARADLANAYCTNGCHARASDAWCGRMCAHAL